MGNKSVEGGIGDQGMGVCGVPADHEGQGCQHIRCTFRFFSSITDRIDKAPIMSPSIFRHPPAYPQAAWALGLVTLAPMAAHLGMTVQGCYQRPPPIFLDFLPGTCTW